LLQQYVILIIFFRVNDKYHTFLNGKRINLKPD